MQIPETVPRRGITSREEVRTSSGTSRKLVFEDNTRISSAAIPLDLELIFSVLILYSISTTDTNVFWSLADNQTGAAVCNIPSEIHRYSMLNTGSALLQIALASEPADVRNWWTFSITN
jgi:hypothetical protein